MIVCVKGHPSNNHLSTPGFDLIEDPVVRKACESVADEPDLPSALERLKEILDPNLYEVGKGGHHIYVASTTDKDPEASGWPLRHALLVDPSDESLWHSYPFLKEYVR